MVIVVTAGMTPQPGHLGYADWITAHGPTAGTRFCQPWNCYQRFLVEPAVYVISLANCSALSQYLQNQRTLPRWQDLEPHRCQPM